MAKLKFKIDFTNEKNGKLFFWEATTEKGNSFAYITPDDPDIHYKTAEGDIRKWPKNDLGVFITDLLIAFAEQNTEIRIDKKSKTSKPKFGLKYLVEK